MIPRHIQNQKRNFIQNPSIPEIFSSLFPTESQGLTNIKFFKTLIRHVNSITKIGVCERCEADYGDGSLHF